MASSGSPSATDDPARGAVDRRERAPSALAWSRRAAVPLRIAPLVVVGLILVVLAVIAATTL